MYTKHTYNIVWSTLPFEWKFNWLTLCFIYRMYMQGAGIQGYFAFIFTRPATEQLLVKGKSTAILLLLPCHEA